MRNGKELSYFAKNQNQMLTIYLIYRKFILFTIETFLETDQFVLVFIFHWLFTCQAVINVAISFKGL